MSAENPILNYAEICRRNEKPQWQLIESVRMKKIVVAMLVGISGFGLVACGGGTVDGSSGAPSLANVTVTANPMVVSMGETATYSFVVSNPSNKELKNVGLSSDFGVAGALDFDRLPKTTCSAGSYSASSDNTFQIGFSSLSARSNCQIDIVVTAAKTGTISPKIGVLGDAKIVGTVPVIVVNASS